MTQRWALFKSKSHLNKSMVTFYWGDWYKWFLGKFCYLYMALCLRPKQICWVLSLLSKFNFSSFHHNYYITKSLHNSAIFQSLDQNCYNSLFLGCLRSNGSTKSNCITNCQKYYYQARGQFSIPHSNAEMLRQWLRAQKIAYLKINR